MENAVGGNVPSVIIILLNQNFIQMDVPNNLQINNT
jgi:hypothetical protein